MRLGLYPCKMDESSRSFQAYRETIVYERHRHRYEFNNVYWEDFEKAGVLFAGTSPDRRLVEIVEVVDHPWFVATQFHPEFKSRPHQAHPLFHDFIAMASSYKQEPQHFLHLKQE